METIRNYTLTNSNRSTKQQASVTVRNQYNQVCARIYSPCGKLLQRIRRELLCSERADMIDQLTRAGVPSDDIMALVNGRE